MPITAPTVPAAGGTDAAVIAFLRGVERRGAVFAELLCGDPMRGDAALALAMRAFGNVATQAPVDQWPQQFWRLLLASPQLRVAAPGQHWPTPLASLAPLGMGKRAALLLRLVAGLDDAEAAAVLGIALPTHRLALQRGLPRLSDGSPDAIGWKALAETLQRALRQLPEERLAHLPHRRGTVVAGRPPEPVAPPKATWRDTAPRRQWLRPVLWTALAACAIVFTGTFIGPGSLRVEDDPQVQATPLPRADAPTATFDAETALLTHRDFDQLTDPDGAGLVNDLDFYAWYAAQVATQPTGAPLLLPDAGMPLPDALTGGGHASR